MQPVPQYRKAIKSIKVVPKVKSLKSKIKFLLISMQKILARPPSQKNQPIFSRIF